MTGLRLVWFVKGVTAMKFESAIKYELFLTNGDIRFKMESSSETHFGIFIPEDVVLAEDHEGNLYINGLPATVEARKINELEAAEW